MQESNFKLPSYPDKVIAKWIETATEREIEHPYEPEAIPTNFAHISDNAKIVICDTIIDHAKDVFGPNGGYYISKVGSNKSEVNDRIRLTKSKDGHNFFKSIEMINNQAQAVLTGIQGYTEYISDVSNVETSKDGTTSLAMVGASLGKFLLTNRELLRANGDPKGVRNIPSTIYNIVFDVITEEGTKLIEENCVSIYDKETNNYTEDGYEYLIKALETTTDHDPVLLEGFKNMIDFARDKQYDIRQAHLSAVEYKSGTPKIEVQFKTGFQTPGTEVDRMLSAGFRDQNSVMLILDGFIEVQNENLFMIEFQNFLEKHILGLKVNDQMIFDMGENSFDLVILVTRTPETLVERYKQMHSNGIQKSYIFNGQSKTIKVKPRFITIRNDEYFEVHYADIAEMFKASIINLNHINKYINAHRDPILWNPELNKWKSEAKKIEGINITNFFPTVSNGMIIKPISEVTEDPKIYKIGDDIEFKVPNVEFLVETDEKTGKQVLSVEGYSLQDILNVMSYDGSKIFILPTNPEIDAKGRKIREELIKLRDSYKQGSFEDTTGLQYRIDMFNSITMFPIISAMSDAEMYQLQTLYEDALGIFFSVHDHGVLPGANTFFIKKYRELHDRVMEVMRVLLKDTGEKQKDRYLEFTEMLLDSIFSAYTYVYSFLDEDWKERIIGLMRVYDLLETFNVVSGRVEKQVIESARTTRDIFVASLSIAKDLLMIKRIKIGAHDLRDMLAGNRYATLHPMNLVTSAQSDKVKEIKDQYRYKINELGGY